MNKSGTSLLMHKRLDVCYFLLVAVQDDSKRDFLSKLPILGVHFVFLAGWIEFN